MYWLIYRNTIIPSGNIACMFSEYEEIEQFVEENKKYIEVIDIAIPYDVEKE